MRFRAAPAATFRASRAATTTWLGCRWRACCRNSTNWAGRKGRPRCSRDGCCAPLSLVPLVALIAARKGAAPRHCQGARMQLSWTRLLLRSRLRPCVVLLVIDILGSGILFLADLLFLAPRELAAVRCAVGRYLLVDALLLVLKL